MKVLHVINSLAIGGAEKLVVDSLVYYKNELEQVDLLALKKTKKNFEERVPNNTKIDFLTNKSIYSPILILKIIPYLKKYDIFHVHLFPALYWVVLAKLISFSKVKIVYTEHSTENKRRKNKILKYLDRFIYGKLDFIGCISEATKHNLENHLNNRNKNISVIFNGIDLKDFVNSEDNSNNSYDFFEKDSFILIQVSSFRVQKDQKTVIRALQLLPEKIKLILVGDGNLRASNEELVKELNLQNRVKFLGIRNDIPMLMQYADVCILSSLYEGFGLAILEGMASKKPSIASNVDGLREIVENYGLLFEQGSEKQLSYQIMKLYQNKLYYNEVAIKCYRRALEFDIKQMVNQYIKVYENVI